MENFNNVKEKINEMSELTLSMLKTTFDGFMKHDVEILANVLRDEQRLNAMEKTITLSLIEISKGKVTNIDKKKIMLLTNIVADLEEIGDYAKDMIERIEIKIQEKLLFSDEALSEYKHLYSVIETGLSDTVSSLKTNDKMFAKRVLTDKEDIDKLIKKYRDAHTQRLLSGICDPRAGNMFLNLLDFTGQIFHHTKSISTNILKLR
jgi:phosphate:Na+ symporter